jgi:hypothetical protein
MNIQKTTYQFSDIAITYTIHQLFEIAGITLRHNTEINFNREASSVTIVIGGNKQVVFKVMEQNKIKELLKGELILQNISSYDSKVNVPLFFTDHENNFATISDEKLIVHADIVTISFIMLSRYEETLTTKRDKHNRYQYKHSLAFKYKFIDIPIVDEYAMLLRKFLIRFFPGLEIHRREGKVIPTHDIDELHRFGNLFRNIVTIIGGDLIARRSFSIARLSLKQRIATTKDTKNDPLILAIERLVKISKAMGLYSIFYFKGLQKGQKDCTYDIFDPDVRFCMEIIKDAGMTVGIHGGYDSYNNDEIYQQEKNNIETVYGEAVTTSRQHFLRFDINNTTHVLQNCNVQNDSTLGYAEREGFRCGTCHEYFLYDLKNDCISTVKESPLIVMEGTLLHYRRQQMETALTICENLYERCQAVEGDFIILWHNQMMYRDYEKIFSEFYCKLLEKISKGNNSK